MTACSPSARRWPRSIARWGWGGRVLVWHEAADIRLFHPPAVEGEREGLVWIGNWGDDERTEELESFLFGPAQRAGLRARRPRRALSGRCAGDARRYGARYRGWLPNAAAPEVFARHLATVHVPRRFYVDMLPGIPTIRVFEALACGIPLVSAPWNDSEGLFRPAQDFLVARDGDEMERHLRDLAARPGPAPRRWPSAALPPSWPAIPARTGCEELLAIRGRARRPARGGPQDAPA